MRRSTTERRDFSQARVSRQRARRQAAVGLESLEVRSLLSAGAGARMMPDGTMTAGPTSGVHGDSVLADRLIITQQPPATCDVNNPFAMTVAVTDASGAVDTLFDGTVTIGLVQNPTSATLAGTLTVSAIHGIAAFSSLSLNEVGMGYVIAATSDGLRTVTTSPINIVPVTVPGPALHILSITPDGGNYRALPGGQIVVTFNQPLADLAPDVASGGGFITNPFAVSLVPRGPTGGFAAPSGLDAGSTPIHATLVYHVNPDKTSTITLIPRAPLGTDIYLITVSGTLVSNNGSPLTDSAGKGGPEYSTFELKTTPPNSLPFKVISVTTRHASVSIGNNATIAQPDTIAIGFNKPVDYLMLNNSTVQLLAGPFAAPVPAVVAYSPTTRAVYITPTVKLLAGTKYTVRVAGTVTDNQGFPNPDTDYSLGATFARSFFVQAGNAPSSSPLVALSAGGHLLASPGHGPARTTPFGYASIPFSESLDLSKAGRFSIMLTPQRGGLNDNAPDSADTTLNARVAFNPNVNELIVVPTVPTGNDIYWYSLNNLKATNGDPLVNPGGTLPVRDSFALAIPASIPAARTSAMAAELASGQSRFDAGCIPPEMRPFPFRNRPASP